MHLSFSHCRPQHTTGTARSSDFTDPLEEYEDPKPTLRGVLGW